MNNEHEFVEAESIGTEIIEADLEESLANKFDIDQDRIQEKIKADAQKRANKLIKKNKHRLKRLKTHAGNCLLNGNYEGYSYAIKELRKFYKQSYNEDLIKAMWHSSRGAILDIAKQYEK